jgi:hypothetical protein
VLLAFAGQLGTKRIQMKLSDFTGCPTRASIKELGVCER